MHRIDRRGALARLGLLGLAPLLAPGCTVLNQVGSQAFLMSAEQERELGQRLATEVPKQYPLYRKDPEATKYLRNLGSLLVRGAPPIPYPVEFDLIASEDINAFAIPGGHVYVHLGLLQAAETEHELAAVVAHEIGHVAARHSAKAISQSQFYELLFTLALGQDAAGWADLATNVWQSGILLQNSRANEYEADAISIETLARTGYNPGGLVSFFAKLQEESGGSTPRFLQYLSTHPLTGDRIQRARSRIGSMQPPAGGWPQESSLAFRQLKLRYPRPKA